MLKKQTRKVRTISRMIITYMIKINQMTDIGC